MKVLQQKYPLPLLNHLKEIKGHSKRVHDLPFLVCIRCFTQVDSKLNNYDLFLLM
jgi:hypothetical protein